MCIYSGRNWLQVSQLFKKIQNGNGGYELISTSLLANIDIKNPIDAHADLHIGWEELLQEPVDLKNYVGFVPQLADLWPKTPVLG